MTDVTMYVYEGDELLTEFEIEDTPRIGEHISFEEEDVEKEWSNYLVVDVRRCYCRDSCSGESNISWVDIMVKKVNWLEI